MGSAEGSTHPQGSPDISQLNRAGARGMKTPDSLSGMLASLLGISRNQGNEERRGERKRLMWDAGSLAGRVTMQRREAIPQTKILGPGLCLLLE